MGVDVIIWTDGFQTVLMVCLSIKPQEAAWSQETTYTFPSNWSRTIQQNAFLESYGM